MVVCLVEYSHIRKLLLEFKHSLQSPNLKRKGISGAPVAAPTFSIRKVTAHAGIKGNEKADMLAEMGQHKVCNSGRYSISSQNNLPINCLHDSSKNSDLVSKCSLNHISKNLEVTHFAHETSFEGQFPHFSSTPPSLRQQLNSNRSSSSSSSASSSPTLHPFGLVDY